MSSVLRQAVEPILGSRKRSATLLLGGGGSGSPRYDVRRKDGKPATDMQAVDTLGSNEGKGLAIESVAKVPA
jgi:hypothetical protein